MKYCKVFGVLFVSLLVFISCSDDDKPDVPVGDTADRIGVVSKADFDKYVVGKYWKISERAFFDSDGMATDERLSGTFGGTVAQYFSDVNIYSDYFDAGPVAEKPIQGQYYYIKDNPFSYDEKTGLFRQLVLSEIISCSMWNMPMRVSWWLCLISAGWLEAEKHRTSHMSAPLMSL